MFPAAIGKNSAKGANILKKIPRKPAKFGCRIVGINAKIVLSRSALGATAKSLVNLGIFSISVVISMPSVISRKINGAYGAMMQNPLNIFIVLVRDRHFIARQTNG